MDKDAGNLFCFEQHDDVLVVIPQENAGSLMNRDVQREWAEGITQFDSAAHRIVIDLAQMQYFGSVMLEWKISVWRHVQKNNGAMAACNASSVAREILKIAKFDRLFPLFDTREKAIEYVRNFEPEAD